jgi:uncharacterized protein YgbK (DUF1537 family)
LVWELRSRAPFIVASSGFTHGLAEYWLANGLLCEGSMEFQLTAADRIIVISGSCSPITERQIRWSLAHGFVGLRAEASNIADAGFAERARSELIDAAMQVLHSGKSAVVYTALGPNDCEDSIPRQQLAIEMGRLLRELVQRSGVKRVAIAGGDTSSHAGQQLGIYALTMRASLAPGAPLCEAHTHDSSLCGLEIVLKGGQVGAENFFASVLAGHI